MNALVPRETIEQICLKRDSAVRLYAEAFQKLNEASKAASDAAYGGFSHYTNNDDKLYDINVGEEKWTKQIRQAIDRGVWRHLFQMTDIERLMDTKAKEEFYAQLRKDPVPVTPENCFATISNLVASSHNIFLRGIANVFSRLDRRFKSHDGFKIGRRIILDRAFSESGTWNYSLRIDDVLRDIERTFCVLDAEKHPEYSVSFPAMVMNARRERPGLTEFSNPHFKMRWFANGNAHLWLQRPDLVYKVNKLLAEYYGDALGDSHAKSEPQASRAMAKNLGFFQTSVAVVERIIDSANLWTRDGEKLSVLEPSAGLGRIALAAAAAGGEVTAVEIDPGRATALKSSPALKYVECADFLDLTPDYLGLFDRVLMNPPFDRQLDIDHVLHAWKFVKPGGALISVMSCSVEYSETKKAEYFRDIVTSVNGNFQDLPDGSFAESGTMVNTLTVTMVKPAFADD